MTEFYIPKSQTVDFDGRPLQITRGIHEVPDSLADHGLANDLGIKPVEEMTDDEWRGLMLNRDEWMRKNRPPAPVQALSEPARADSRQIVAQASAPSPASAKDNS